MERRAYDKESAEFKAGEGEKGRKGERGRGIEN